MIHLEKKGTNIALPLGGDDSVIMIDPTTGFGYLEHFPPGFRLEKTRRVALLLGYLPPSLLGAGQEEWIGYFKKLAMREWTPLRGVRISAAEMRKLPDHDELRAWEEERLEWEPERIWNDETIPTKIRRKILLEKLGFHPDPHFFVPGEIAQSCLLAMVLKMRRSRENDGERVGLGVSTASINDRLMGTMPALRIAPNKDDGDVKQEIAEFIIKVKTTCGDDWSQLMFHFYPNPWDDPGRVAGARLRVETELLRSSGGPLPHFLEIIAGWPRSIDKSIPGVGHYYRRRGVVIRSPQFGVIVKNNHLKEEKIPKDNIGIILAAKDLISSSLDDPNLRARIMTLQRLVGTNDITFDICFHIDDKGIRNVYWFDFDAVPLS